MSGAVEDLETMNFATGCGTLSYMAPEIFQTVHDISKGTESVSGYRGKPVDIFASGIILFMMTVGTCPF